MYTDSMRSATPHQLKHPIYSKKRIALMNAREWAKTNFDRIYRPRSVPPQHIKPWNSQHKQ